MEEWYENINITTPDFRIKPTPNGWLTMKLHFNGSSLFMKLQLVGLKKAGQGYF